MTSPSATQDHYPYQNEPIWSRSEKVIAYRVFDAAVKRELHEIKQEAKRKTNQMRELVDVWELERYLTQRRKDIDRLSFVAPDARAWGDSCANVE